MVDTFVATSARLEDQRLIVELSDGRTIATPMYGFPGFIAGSESQRAMFEITGSGQGIHWPERDEDLRFDGLVRGDRGAEAV